MARQCRLWVAIALAGGLAALAIGPSHSASITNGSFETDGFAGWIIGDIEAPIEELAVRVVGAELNLGSTVIPSDGSFAVSHGFGSVDKGGTISIAQDVFGIESGDVLTFDYRAGWDLRFDQSDRTFEVRIEPKGGGDAIETILILTAAAGKTESPDSGPLSKSIDLSSFAGTDARVSFVWTVPEWSLGPGPANAQLDNVSIGPVPVPAALPLFVGALAGLGVFGWRYRKAA